MRIYGTLLLAVFVVVFGLVNCGTDQEDCTLNGNNCSSEKVYVEGSPGPQGQPGTPGKDGKPGTTGKDGKDGVDGETGPQGEIGPPGSQGTAGTNGSNGFSVVYDQIATAPTCPNGGHTLMLGVDVNRNGLLDIGVDGSIQTMPICNGMDGQDGEDGNDAPPTAFTTTSIVDPCGDAPGIYDEVFLKLANGMLIASISQNAQGDNTRFGILMPGTWVTTDGDNCQFTVNNNNQITNENHHY